MVFLSGDHVLGTNITVANVARVTMRGESSDNIAAIVCNGQVGLSFTSVIRIEIYSMVFTSCGRDYGISPVKNYALLLQSTQHAELVNCLFHENPGTALVVNNTNTTLAGNRFNHNCCESNFSCLGGCGVTALNSKVTFTGNTVLKFLETLQHYKLLLVVAVQSTLHTALNLTSMESETSSATQHTMVVQSLPQTILYLASGEPTTSSNRK